MSVLAVNVEGDVDFSTSLRRDRTPNLSLKHYERKSRPLKPDHSRAEIESQSLSEQAKDIPNEHELT